MAQELQQKTKEAAMIQSKSKPQSDSNTVVNLLRAPKTHVN